MGGGVKQDEDDLITDINVTPLVDIVLVLLIVLMVTSSYLVNKAINVELPKAATGEVTTPTMTISLLLDGTLWLDGTKVDEKQLQDRVRDAFRANAEVKAVISADGGVKHSQVVTVIDILRRENVTKFAINTSPIQEKGK